MCLRPPSGGGFDVADGVAGGRVRHDPENAEAFLIDGLDGQVYDLSNAQPFTNFSDFGAATKESRKGFIVPTDLIRKIAASHRTWLRVTTSAGNYEDAVIDGQTDSKAYHALRRFVASVDQG